MMTIYVDGGARPNPGSMIGCVLVEGCSPEIFRFGSGTNNRAEYLALIEALKIARKMRVKVRILTDSLLVYKQVYGFWNISENQDLHQKALKLLEGHISLEWISRKFNLAGKVLKHIK